MLHDSNARSILSRIVPLILVLVAVAALIILVLLIGRDPAITSVTPVQATGGTTVAIEGAHFGDRPGDVRIAGRSIPRSLISLWTDTSIRFVLPDAAVSGLLQVISDRGQSRGVLFQAADDIPVAGDESAPVSPVIAEIGSADVTIGTIIEIRGEGFGANRRTSRVEFPRGGQDLNAIDESIAYPVWSDSLIRVRVPDGVIDGFLRVRTPWGISNPVRVAVQRPVGVVERSETHEIVVKYGVALRGAELEPVQDSGPGDYDVAIRIPVVPATFAQDQIRILTQATSGSVERMAFSQYETIRNQVANGPVDIEIDRIVLCDRYQVSARVDPSRISPSYEHESGFFAYYTQPLPHLPVDSEEITAAAAQAAGGRASPYRIAEAVYGAVTSRLQYAVTTRPIGPIEGLSLGYGDDFTYASLFVSMCRAAGVPARVVGGVVVPDERSVYTHFWAEFFIPAFGWFPVDPGFGDGGFPARFPAPDDPLAYYFGRLDPHRIAFQHGYDPSMASVEGNLLLGPPDPYSIQGVYLEAGRAVRALDVAWIGPEVITVYDHTATLVDSR